MSVSDDSSRLMAGETASPSAGALRREVTRLIEEVRALAHDHLELATLETRLTAKSLVRIAIVSIFAALVLVTAWLALVGSAALGLISLGMAPALAMLLVAIANILVAVGCWLQIKRLSHWLGWGATQRAIKQAASSEPDNAEKRGVS